MTDEEKLYGLMTQAEDLQKHAAKLQKEAREVFSELPLAVVQAGRNIRSTGLQMAFILLIFGGVVSGAVIAFLIWSTNSLRDERAALQTELSGLKVSIQAEANTLAEMKSKTWGIELIENAGKRWIRLKRGDKPGAAVNWENGKWQGIEVKP